MSLAATAAWSTGERPTRAELPALAGAPNVKVAAADPVGDTFGAGTPQIDLTELAAEILGSDLVITLRFTEAPSAPDSGESNALDGFVDLDLDQDGATGDVPWTDFLRPDAGGTGMGNEAYIDLFTYDSSTGEVDVIDDATETLLGSATATFTGTQLELSVPLAVLGDDGEANVAAIIGTVDEPTDLAPNQGSVSSDETPTVALRNGRFLVEVEWMDFEGNTGPGRVVTTSEDSALLWFFGPDNWELLIKVLDGCPVNDRYWVFSAATTNVGYTLRVTDTAANIERVYTNPLGVAAPAITDTGAFATCP